jgi:addiction module RelE/StbE family toxin
MIVRWSPEAAEDLDRISRRILLDNPAAARRVANTIYKTLGSLTRSPLRGRIGRIEGTRELVFTPLPYIAVYRVREDTVEIARVYHAAQDWP